MGKPSRDKGARGEREVAAIFRAAGFDCNRVPNSGGLRLKGDLYGASVRVGFVQRLRDERMFDGLDGLRAQIAADCGRARVLFDRLSL